MVIVASQPEGRRLATLRPPVNFPTWQPSVGDGFLSENNVHCGFIIAETGWQKAIVEQPWNFEQYSEHCFMTYWYSYRSWFIFL